MYWLYIHICTLYTVHAMWQFHVRWLFCSVFWPCWHIQWGHTHECSDRLTSFIYLTSTWVYHVWCYKSLLKPVYSLVPRLSTLMINCSRSSSAFLYCKQQKNWKGLENEANKCTCMCIEISFLLSSLTYTTYYSLLHTITHRQGSLSHNIQDPFIPWCTVVMPCRASVQ